MEPTLVEAFIGVMVALLGGDRLVTSVKARRNGHSSGLATKQDVQEVKDLVTAYHTEFREHKAFHQGRESVGG